MKQRTNEGTNERTIEQNESYANAVVWSVASSQEDLFNFSMINLFRFL